MASSVADSRRAVHELIGLALIAVLGGGSGAWGFLQVQPPRPDPFTGADGRQLEERLTARTHRLEQEHESLKAWQKEWGATRQDVPQRLARIEALLELNGGRLADISDRLRKVEERRP